MSGFNRSTLEAIIDRIQRSIEDIRKGIEDVRNTINSAIDAAATLTAGLLDSLLDQIRQLWVDLRDGVVRVIEAINKVLKWIAAPFAFDDRALSWIDDVQTPMHGIESDTSPDRLILDNEWNGEAASAYKQGVASQSKAAGAVSAIGKTMGEQLQSCASAGLIFYTAVVGATAVYIVTQVAGAVQCATVAGAPSGIVTIIAGQVALITAIAAATANLDSTLQGAEVKMHSALADFPGQDWPVGTN